MKKVVLVLLILVLSNSLFSQEEAKTKQKEVGLTFYNLDHFGITFRFGNNKSLWRINSLVVSGSQSIMILDSSENYRGSIGFNLKFGKEFRKVITEKLEFRYGGDLSGGYQSSHTNSEQGISSSKFQTQNYGANFVIGFNYVMEENFIIGLELLPGVNYYTTKRTWVNSSNEEMTNNSYYLDYRLSNASALLSVAYRF